MKGDYVCFTHLNSITNDGNIWTQEDKFMLESQLVLATSKKLCLHPSPIVAIIKHKILWHKNKLNERKIKKYFLPNHFGLILVEKRYNVKHYRFKIELLKDIRKTI